MQSSIENRAERLLSALGGVVSARAVADEFGRLCEIHILASPDLHPKQIVRNVESALSAGLGVVVDRRIVSVAQLRQDAPRPSAEHRNKPVDRAERFVYEKFETSSTSSLDSRCSVLLRRGGEHVSATATGMNTPQGRAETAARAVFQALQEKGEAVGLEGTTLVQAHGKSYVLVSARSMTGRSARVLTGIAALARSPEEAGIFAALQATNRLASQPE